MYLFYNLPSSFKVYMTDFFLLAWLNLPNVLISVAKKFFFHSDFPFPCFDVPKASNFTSGGVQKQRTENDCDVNSGLQASRKTDFSVIFLLSANQFAKKWYNSALLMVK